MRIASLSAVALTLFAIASARADTPKVGDTAPNFTLSDQNGKPVKLSDFAGKVVVLEWFNDGCPYVQKHYSTNAMNTLAANYAKQGVVWLAINSTKSADVSHNADVVSKWSMSRPILDDHTGIVGHLYGATNTPDMYVIDADGKIVYLGAIDSVDSTESADIANAKNYVSMALDDVLAGKPVTTSQTSPYGCTVKYAG